MNQLGQFEERYIQFTRELKSATATKHEFDQALLYANMKDQEGLRVLDAPCGYGRFAGPVIAAGHSYVGVDRVGELIDVARLDNAHLREAEWHCEDLAGMSFLPEFDLALNLFTSFGYDEDENSLACLVALRKALKPSGKLVLECMNGPWLTDLFLSGRGRFNVFEYEWGCVLDQHSLSDDRRFHHIARTYTRANSPDYTTSFRLRLLSSGTLGEWLKLAGFCEIEFYGKPGELFEPARHQFMVAVATAP